MGISDQNTGAGEGAGAGADDAALKSILRGLLNSTQAYVDVSG